MGPEVDTNWMTSEGGIFAAGNVLRGADMHDFCALEGRQAAGNIVKHMQSGNGGDDRFVAVRAIDPIRHIVPQKLLFPPARNWRTSFRTPGVSIQVSRTMKNVTLEAWSGSNRIWSKGYPRLVANNRIAIPVEKFHWGRVDASNGIVLTIATKFS